MELDNSLRLLSRDYPWLMRGIVICGTTLLGIATAIWGNIAPPSLIGGRTIFTSSAVFLLAAIWFGIWGLPAALAGGMIYQIFAGQNLLVAFLIGLGDLTMSGIVGFSFRRLKLEYTLKTNRDWFWYILIMLFSPIPSAWYSMTILVLSGSIAWTSFWLGLGFWVFGAYLIIAIIVTLALVMLSPLLEKQGLIFPTFKG